MRADQQRHEDKKHEQANSVARVFNTDSQGDTKNKTWEASTLTGVLREQTRRVKNNLPVSSTCCRFNTDHKDVAMLHEFWPHLHNKVVRGIYCKKDALHREEPLLDGNAHSVRYGERFMMDRGNLIKLIQKKGQIPKLSSRGVTQQNL